MFDGKIDFMDFNKIKINYGGKLTCRKIFKRKFLIFVILSNICIIIFAVLFSLKNKKIEGIMIETKEFLEQISEMENSVNLTKKQNMEDEKNLNEFQNQIDKIKNEIKEIRIKAEFDEKKQCFIIDKSTSMAKIFARDSYGCIVVTDISINETPREIFNWKEIIRQESSFIDNEAIPFILIGNKIDLIEKEEERAIIDDRTKNICQNYGFLNYFLTSAKEGINVNESMKFLLEYIIDRMNKFSRENNVEFGQKRKDTIKLTK